MGRVVQPSEERDKRRTAAAAPEGKEVAHRQ